jgi:hypothetical protein
MENQKQNILIIESLNLLSEKKINEHLNNNNYEYIIINIFSKTSILINIPIFCKGVFILHNIDDIQDSINKYFKIPFDCQIVCDYKQIKRVKEKEINNNNALIKFNISKLINYNKKDFNNIIVCHTEGINIYFSNTKYFFYEDEEIYKDTYNYKKYKFIRKNNNSYFYHYIN